MQLRLSIVCFVCLTSLASPCAAAVFSWDFQRTGFRASGDPQTALSMRNNRTWPIVYTLDQSRLNAYTLLPVPYTGQTPIFNSSPTYFHPIGEDLTQSFISSGTFLQADSGHADGFGVSMQRQFASPQEDVVVHGTYAGGFAAPLTNSQALTFDSNDNPYIAASSLIPALNQTGARLYDVALSSIGDVAAISQQSSSGPLTYWQKSPLLGSWESQVVGDQFGSLVPMGASADLLFDGASRPHVLAKTANTSVPAIMAYRFDIVSGGWLSSTLDTVTGSFNPSQVDVAAATNDQGIVGAAWVNNGVLKYAFLDTTKTTQSWTITTVTASTPTGEQLEPAQGVGLAYDAAGLPVISFIERNNRQVWIAYDPPVTAMPGDFNRDGAVNDADLGEWQSGFGADGRGDADADGDSDGNDFLVWQQNLTSSPQATTSAAVPEPAFGALATTLAVAGVMFRRPRRSAHTKLDH